MRDRLVGFRLSSLRVEETCSSSFEFVHTVKCACYGVGRCPGQGELACSNEACLPFYFFFLPFLKFLWVRLLFPSFRKRVRGCIEHVSPDRKGKAMKETWPESFSEIGLRLEWWCESTGKIMTVVLAHESHAPLAPLHSFFFFIHRWVVRGAKMIADYVRLLSSFQVYCCIWFGVKFSFYLPLFISLTKCKGTEELITCPIVQLLLVEANNMQVKGWRNSYSYLFFFSLYRAPSILVHSGRMRKWGLISPDGRWIDSRSLWSRYMSSAITISDRFFCTFVSWENSGRLHPIHPVAHSTPSSAAVPLICPLDHGPPRGAHYLIENCLHTRALVSNYRCGCIEKWLFPKKKSIWRLQV